MSDQNSGRAEWRWVGWAQLGIYSDNAVGIDGAMVTEVAQRNDVTCQKIYASRGYNRNGARRCQNSTAKQLQSIFWIHWLAVGEWASSEEI